MCVGWSLSCWQLLLGWWGTWYNRHWFVVFSASSSMHVWLVSLNIGEESLHDSKWWTQQWPSTKMYHLSLFLLHIRVCPNRLPLHRLQQARQASGHHICERGAGVHKIRNQWPHSGRLIALATHRGWSTHQTFAIKWLHHFRLVCGKIFFPRFEEGITSMRRGGKRRYECKLCTTSRSKCPFSMFPVHCACGA